MCRQFTLTALLLLAACVAPRSATPAVPVEPAAPPAAQGKPLSEDTVLKLQSGATFLGPGGWWLTSDSSALQLEDPEKELALFVMERSGATAGQVIAEAWKSVRPSFNRSVDQTVSPPATGGWDEIVQITYQTAAEEKRLVLGVARRKGVQWYLALIDASAAAIDRRAAQVNTIITSLKAPGVNEESFAGKVAHPLSGTRLQVFLDFVEATRRALNIPGVSIAIVQGEKVAASRGFGERETGKPVTPATLFMLGSVTKSLTTLMMAKLVDEGKMTWQTPVTSLLPRFALGDAEATRKLELRHTVCACTGLPRQDMEFFFDYANATPEQRLQEMQSMKPTTGFGETFQYSNSLVSAGGYIAAQAFGGTRKDPRRELGTAFDLSMANRVFQPLGMKRTTFDFGAVQRNEHALPHGPTLRPFEFVALPLSAENWVTSIRPAGGAWSNATDMAQYLLLELGGGTSHTQGWVTQANLLKRREPMVKISEHLHYGLGLMISDARGVTQIGHGGNTLGFSSDVFFLPEHQVGAVVLTNAGNANLFLRVVRRRLLELLFEGKEEAQEMLTFGIKLEQETAEKELARMHFSPELALLQPWLGRYAHSTLGQVVLASDSKGDVMTLGTKEWKSAVALKNELDGTRKLVLASPPLAGLEFRLVQNETGHKLVLETPQQTYEFLPTSP